MLFLYQQTIYNDKTGYFIDKKVKKNDQIIQF
jgi:hypothetical protein